MQMYRESLVHLGSSIQSRAYGCESGRRRTMDEAADACYLQRPAVFLQRLVHGPPQLPD